MWFPCLDDHNYILWQVSGGYPPYYDPYYDYYADPYYTGYMGRPPSGGGKHRHHSDRERHPSKDSKNSDKSVDTNKSKENENPEEDFVSTCIQIWF